MINRPVNAMTRTASLSFDTTLRDAHSSWHLAEPQESSSSHPSCPGRLGVDGSRPLPDHVARRLRVRSGIARESEAP